MVDVNLSAAGLWGDSGLPGEAQGRGRSVRRLEKRLFPDQHEGFSVSAASAVDTSPE